MLFQYIGMQQVIDISRLCKLGPYLQILFVTITINPFHFRDSLQNDVPRAKASCNVRVWGLFAFVCTLVALIHRLSQYCLS